MVGLPQYEWILVCSGFLAFFAAFGIGMPRCHSPEGTELLFLSLQFPHAHLNLRPSRPSLSLGANDVSNAFATSVGSGAINLKSAVAIAAVCEFSGAVLMGGSVAETIRKGIADLSEFEGEPEVLMYGMMCVLLTVAMWLLVATQMGLPVSTTHTTVGGVIGMSMVARGASRRLG